MGEGGILRILQQENQGDKWKNNRRPTSVAMIMLDFNDGASNLFFEIRDKGRDLDIYLGGHCRKNSSSPGTIHRILRKFHRVALNILLYHPLWRLLYWHFFCDFYDCLFGLEGVGVLKKEQCQWCFIWHWCFPLLHTGVQMPVLKNQCILFSCFPSFMR